ncbi:hypothetical protein MRS44_017615 [Fusarium solani]|uniref:uncharacterized protein n=1 Tax=Fusarium solani TaxID=169388 RepID=UPI0032C3DF77|nr:hypothetical protein MRS44_017615 [Fusarium solani]
MLLTSPARKASPSFPTSETGKSLQHTKNEKAWDTDVCTDAFGHIFVEKRAVLSPVVLQLVPRGNDCVKCDDSTRLQCPKCSDGESCKFTVPLDCPLCAAFGCMKDEEAESDKGGGGLTIGGIIGGIIGTIVMIAVATYLVWRSYIKPKRSQAPTSIKVEDVDPVQNSANDAALRGTRPPSTHTVHSIAPTVLTQASNIIQIAYIPGVTNRATPTSPNLLVPLVPLIPMHHAEGSRGHGNNDQHFFVPSDLQDSIYSSLSGYSDRTSYARTPYAPRPAFTAKYGAQHSSTAPQRSLPRQSNRRLHSELS